MQIVSTRTLQFRVKGRQDFVLRPSPRPVFAPEYIRDTNLFQLAVKDGSIQEFVANAAPLVPVVPPLGDDAAKKAAEAKAEADKAAADKTEAAKNAAEAKVVAEIEQAKADLAKNDKKTK